MSVWNVKRTWNRPFFVHCRRHACPVCGGELETVKVSRIVHHNSDEAKDFDFSSAGGDTYMLGNVKFIWTEFHCSGCDKNYSIDEIYNIEKGKRRCP